MSDSDSPVDLTYLEEYTGGDPEAVQELLEIFHETMEEGLEELKNNITEGENKTWSEAAHKLKGASGYVGATNLRELCAKAQDMITATLDERTALFGQITENYARVKKFLEENNT